MLKYGIPFPMAVHLFIMIILIIIGIRLIVKNFNKKSSHSN